MRNLWMMTLVLTTVAVLPGIASATHFGDVVVEADCDGWWAQVGVQWRGGIYAGDLNYVITLAEGNGNVVEDVVWAGQIGRNVGDPAAMVYNFSGDWSGALVGPQFTVAGMFHLVAPYPGGVDDYTANVTTAFTCAVANENTTWSTIKTLYQ
jgi:hypothetical protein